MARRLAHGVLACVLLLLLAFPHPGRAQARREVVIGMVQEPDSLNPNFYTTLASHVTFPIFLDPVVTYDDDWKLVPVLVEQIPTVANGGVKIMGDRQEVTWTLKANLKWHDGRPLTSEDVVFTHSLVADENVPVYYPLVGKAVDKIVARDSRTVVVHYKEISAFGSQAITDNFIMPKHILEPLYKAGGARLREAPYGRDPQATVGSGPFRLREWQQGVHMLFEANPSYHRGRPGVDRIIIRFFRDQATLVSNIIAGSVHVAAPPPVGITFAQAQQVEDLVKQGRARAVRVDYRRTLIQDALYFNVTNPLLTDKRVRQALAHAINRVAISQALFGGKQPAAFGLFPNNHPAFDTRARRYSYDPSRAKQLLSEAGWRPSPDGTLVNAQGEPMALTIMTTAGNAVRERIQQILQQQLREVGIQLRINNVPSRVLLSEYYYQRKWPHIVLISHNGGEEPFLRRNYHSGNIKPEGEFSGNVMGWRNREADQLLEAIVREPVDEKRAALLKQFQLLWVEELPVLPLYQWLSGSAVSDTLDNYRPSGSSSSPGPYTWNVYEWRWK